MKTKLIWIRHGATKSNELKRYLGVTEEPLSKQGILTLNQNKQKGWYQPVEWIAVSPTKRCLQTAELIYENPPSFQSEKWKEINFGRFEGNTYLDLQKDSYYQAWIDSGGTIPFPEGESREEFIQRCNQGFLEFCDALKKCNPIPKTAALIVHGGTIMAILSSYSNQDYYTYQCKNAEGYCCELEITKQICLHQIKKLKGNETSCYYTTS